MRVKANRAFVVTYHQIRVMVLSIGNEGKCVHEADGFIVIFKVENFFKGIVNESPAQRLLAIELAELANNFSGLQGSTVLMNGVAHAVLFLMGVICLRAAFLQGALTQEGGSNKT